VSSSLSIFSSGFVCSLSIAWSLSLQNGVCFAAQRLKSRSVFTSSRNSSSISSQIYERFYGTIGFENEKTDGIAQICTGKSERNYLLTFELFVLNSGEW
jgi:hypothetical protein